MNIGFDAKRAMMNKTGLGNYSRSVIHALSTNFPSHQYYLYSPAPKHQLFENGSSNIHFEHPTSWHKLASSLWRSNFMVNQFDAKKLSVYHGLSNELPFSISKFKGKKIVTIHDLIFLRYPTWYPYLDRKIYELKFETACKNADIIVAISQQTKIDIVNYFKIDDSKIEVVYQNCAHSFKQFKKSTELDAVNKKYNLPAQFLLYVGTISERKNLLNLIKAIELLPTTISIPLVVLGNGNKYLNLVKNYIQSKKIKSIYFLPNADFSDFAAIYQQATCFIYPSFFEGFGIPIIEALYSKIPIISSVGSCFSEAGGEHSIYINPFKPDEIANAIENVLTDTNLKNKMIENGYAHVLQFNDKKMATELFQIYSK
ncbi:MAG: hypothetical protein RIQ33_676 [Bacteroidota bacterium]|jgi:glycosyltransferase involved in cell wall biosynthesis